MSNKTLYISLSILEVILYRPLKISNKYQISLKKAESFIFEHEGRKNLFVILHIPKHIKPKK